LLEDDPALLDPALLEGPSALPPFVRLGFSNPSKFADLKAKTASPARGFLHTFSASSGLTSSGWKRALFILSTSLLAEAGSALNATSPSAGLSVNINGTMPWKFSDSNSSASAGHSAASAVGMLHLYRRISRIKFSMGCGFYLSVGDNRGLFIYSKTDKKCSIKMLLARTFFATSPFRCGCPWLIHFY
jgi:hypothetical protein